MFKRLLTAAARIARLTELKIMGGIATVKQTGMVVVGVAAATVLALIALCGLHGALFLILAPYWGAAGALAAVSALGLCIAALGVVSVHGYAKKIGPALSAEQIEREIDLEEQRLRATFGVHDQDKESTNGQYMPHKSDANGSPWGDPKVLSAVGIATAGLLGPTRILRTVRMTAGIVSTVALVNRALHEYQAQEERTPNERPPHS
jgi:hypothetical protein